MLEETIGILGFGTIGEAIALGLLRRRLLQPDQICASVRRPDSAEQAHERAGAEVGGDSPPVVERASVLTLVVKPHDL